jgi:UDP-N-acetylmuramoyl-L-alanyl-D-glutamate--2,6-diaminopimelate ligase
MKLSELLKSLQVYHSDTDLHSADFAVRGIACDSKLVSDGLVFVAVRGQAYDGHNFIQEAIGRKALAVVVDLQSNSQRIPKSANIPFIYVSDTRRALASLAAQFYANPYDKMRVTGITGTNGKTTVSYLLEQVARRAGFRPGVIGTVNYRYSDKIISSLNTTPGSLQLQWLGGQMFSEGVTHAIMEVSSHALDQQRVSGIRFAAAVFTNLTQDHLDYHPTLEDYFQAKATLFTSLAEGAAAIINLDDDYGKRLCAYVPGRSITYGMSRAADVYARDIRFFTNGTQLTIYTPDSSMRITTSLIGRHNVLNILAAAAWARSEAIAPDVFKQAIESFAQVPGRLERIDSDRGFTVFVDYAHTEDALKNVISSLREVTAGKIIVVFGCGGDRDKTKRPKMGQVVSELADYAVVTSDNPRSENPADIIQDIIKGAINQNYCVVVERLEAIKKSFSLAANGDIILVAGKGHEDQQIIKDTVIPFSDKEAVKSCLALMSL